MELFSATTGCSDPAVACFFLERADNDVSRAVNFYFDQATGQREEAPAAAAACDSSSGGGGGSSRRSLKRPRGGSEGKNQQQKQQQLAFERVRPSAWSSESSGSGSSKKSGLDQPAAAAPRTEQPGNHAAADASLHPPSAEWTEIAERCVRQGAQFEDKGFPPVPSSLDGRAGKGGGSGAPRDEGKGGRGAGGSGEQDTERARCKCDVKAKVVTVSKAGRNQGRLFYGCVTRKCDFFRWADDDAPHTRQALSLVWRRFSPPRFTLSYSASGSGSDSGPASSSAAAPGVKAVGREGIGVAGGGRRAFKPQDILQGAVGDCWFLAGLAVVSERPDLIGRVVGSNGPLADASGCYEVNLFKGGRWERVVVDSWLPCKDPAKLKGKEKGLDHLPAFAKASNNQIWPCIVEKAFAKQHGSYDAISGGHVCDAFEALTGAPTETVMLDSDDSECNWAKLLSFNQAGFPMGCATAWDPSRGLRDVGLVSTHAYSVLEVRELPPGVRGARQPSIRDWAGLGSAAAAAEQGRRRDGEDSGQPLRLVRVRNPWGKREWTGDWSDKSEKWSDTVRAELGWSDKNDGTFWMTWQDFMTRFQLVDVCKARRGWAHVSVAAQTPPESGTCSSFRIRPPAAAATALASPESDEGTSLAPASTPSTTISTVAAAASTTWAYVTVVQPTKRGRKDSYWYKGLGLLVTEMHSVATNSGGKVGGTHALVAAALGGAKRSLSCEVFLESGKAYTASVVCLGGAHHGRSESSRPAAGAGSAAGFQGFRVTVYSARPVQATSAGGRFGGGGGSGAGQNRLQSFSLGTGAVLAVAPMGGSAVFFVVINASSAEVTLHLSITSLEGATATAPTTPPRATTAPPGETSVLAACPPKSQKVVLVLARTADHGSFRHEFCYRVLQAPPTAALRASAGKTGGAGGGSLGGKASLGSGMFSAQMLLPGAEGVVRRTRGLAASGAAEGCGGGTVSGGDGDVGSACRVGV